MFYFSYNKVNGLFFRVKNGVPYPYPNRDMADRDVQWWNDHDVRLGYEPQLVVIEVDLEAIAKEQAKNNE